MATELKTRKFTVDEYEKMVESRVLTERDNVELLKGDIIEMIPIGERHAACVNQLNQIFSQRFKGRIISVQNPVRIEPSSEPEPDLAILKPADDFYASGHPGPSDIHLLVEVMETSSGIDRDEKRPLYARADISELWLVDLEKNRIEQHLNPSGDQYDEVSIFENGDRISPASFPDVEIDVNELLPSN